MGVGDLDEAQRAAQLGGLQWWFLGEVGDATAAHDTSAPVTGV
jgi:hypothetical protein